MSTYYSHTNDTNDYQLIGNKHEIISSHATRAEAIEALNGPDYIEDTKWGNMDVVAPGESVSGKFAIPEPLQTSTASFAEIFGFEG